MKTTATAEEVRKHFLMSNIDNEAKAVEEVLDKQLDYETSADIVLSIIASTPQEEADKLTLTDKIMWTARQGFIAGFMHCLRTSAEAAEASYKELFGETEERAAV